eukprot:TRINITY_DN1775_c0_g1_i2.p1 TRINITY_DN1775_c0_g1~~TRINITY_DN1775_c0_g1_i2.p1  ORF type:complete len:341 (+),score=83.04 TRINITY_DN1775_c0_g1_i2:235-1257(+)
MKCVVCKIDDPPYLCPKCEYPYCSLDCYQKHGSCTENFFQENVVEELKSTVATDDEKKNMMEILERVNTNFIEGKEDIDLINNLENVDLDDPNLIDSLTPEQLADFHKQIETGTISRLIEEWEPWWRSENESSGIKEITDDENEEENTSVIPLIIPDIPPLSEVSSKPPSELLLNNLVEILYGYCYTMRLYNGDWGDNIVGFLGDFLNISTVLVSTKVYSVLKEAAQGAMENSVHHGTYMSRKYTISVLEDVSLVIQTTKHVIAALCDAYHILKCYREISGSSIKNSECKKIFRAEKKLLFLISWANEVPKAIYETMNISILSILEEMDNNSTKGTTTKD